MVHNKNHFGTFEEFRRIEPDEDLRTKCSEFVRSLNSFGYFRTKFIISYRMFLVQDIVTQ